MSDYFGFEMITKANCPYCDKAKKLLSIEGLPYGATDHAKISKKEAIFEEMQTYPMIALVHRNGEKTLIGGYVELEQFLLEADVSVSDFL